MREKNIVDPAFLRNSNYSYVNYNDEELTSVLCFALARHQKDLILHQQRIELHAKKKNNTLLFSALVDLFTALDNKGLAYKKRMLDKYRNLINTRQAILLTKALTASLPITSPIKNLKQSILNLGVEGKLLSVNHM
jgi:hypothetical protein